MRVPCFPDFFSPVDLMTYAGKVSRNRIYDGSTEFANNLLEAVRQLVVVVVEKNVYIRKLTKELLCNIVHA